MNDLDPLSMPTADDIAGFDGEFLTPRHDGYETARVVRNQRLTRSPAAIARCATVSDVRWALRLARERGLPIAVRGGGHSGAGWCSVEGGVVIDLSSMRSVSVDPDARTAHVGGGALAIDLILAAERHGLAAVTGIHSTVGLGGLLLGLGEGYLTGGYGFGVDNVVEIEMVTAQGDVLRVDAESHPDLFWAMRGAGANFGVVTSITVRLHPLPESTVGGGVTYGPDHLETATDYAWELMHHGPQRAWPGAVFTVDDDGRPNVYVHVSHVGPRDEAAREVERLRRCGVPLTDTVREKSYLDLIGQGGSPGADDSPPRAVWDVYRFDFDDEIERQKDLILDLQRRFLGPSTCLGLWRTPRIDPIGPAAAAPRHPGITVFVGGQWNDPADDERHLRWASDTAAALVESGLARPAANTVNHVGAIDESRLRDLYGPADYARIAGLKARYDPTNMFRSNANIPPADLVGGRP